MKEFLNQAFLKKCEKNAGHSLSDLETAFALDVLADEAHQYAKRCDMTLRDKFAAAAPHEEIDAIIGGAAVFLGMSPASYRPSEHYVKACAKARYIWADTMLEARKEPTP